MTDRLYRPTTLQGATNPDSRPKSADRRCGDAAEVTELRHSAGLLTWLRVGSSLALS